MRRNRQQDAKLSPDNRSCTAQSAEANLALPLSAMVTSNQAQSNRFPQPWVPLGHPALPAHHHQAPCLQGAPSIK